MMLVSDKPLNHEDFKCNFDGIVFDNFAGTRLKTDSGFEFAYIPPGEFMMGEPENQHKVTLTKGFYMQTTQVTQGQWTAVMGSNPSKFEKGSDYPVESVSWHDAQEFVRKLNELEKTDLYRLPSEAEWEYACRARSNKRYCFGDDEGYASEYGWFCNNSGSKTHPVGQKKHNAWGLYDMHGNVWEWCQDWYGSYTSSDVTDPGGPDSGSSKVFRGGSWFSFVENCRAGVRDCDPPDRFGHDLGFRIVKSLHF
ncbi:MAG: formylglycine-generating enzyme family protein [Desulfobacterales bacterium]|nr:formylglycine-generating enzyme family protein [Desulfobacterales bacterium]